MKYLNQILTQTKFDLKRFIRNPAAAFFTIVLPIIFLFIFTSIFGNEIIEETGERVATFYVPGILALSIVSATLVNLAITTTTRREANQLKRLRATPIEPGNYIIAQIFMAIVVSVLMTLLITVIGKLVFDVSFNFDTLPILAVTILLGTASFCALGLALSVIIPSVDAAPAFTNAIVLPLYFFSDVFLVGGELPTVIKFIGNVFPIKHLAHSLQVSYGDTGSIDVPYDHWGVIAVWGIFGAAVAMNFFRWQANNK